ncbi:spore coat protein I [Hathewaya proteolytica DSM 3090]|uniref:Spore coat protein I n=1 Tax=Hathewaya proteolytica DSM 3090 TaxID=1121331 RepID=A0A1M6PG27_9CLOT|nr:CotS family spore coat protein [Hathewaya proteolytica]SHK06840.1 spore coat protein I [Hathewaya proteolytica DSM 3090]
MMRELEIERQFDIKIEKMSPNKGIYELDTNVGKRCLKKVGVGVLKIYFIYGAKEYLVSKGFHRIDRNYLNTAGEPFAIVNEDIYTLSRWIEGREADFQNDDDILMASKALANFNIASRGYEPPENSTVKTDIGKWPSIMEKRIQSFEKNLTMSKKKKKKLPEFDEIYLLNKNFYKDLAIKALDILNTSAYKALCDEELEVKGLCHHDFTYHNIIISPDNEVNIVDFDYCKREIRVFDLATFITKVLKRRNWDINICKNIIDGYNSVSPLRPEEYKVLYAFLMFPQRFWRICNRFYYNETNWVNSTFINKINNIINEKELYCKFLEEFREFYGI